VPFSAGALAYARRLARQTKRFPDDRRALSELLERWDAGLTRNPTERRMALRLAQQRNDRLAAAGEPAANVTDLESVRAVAHRTDVAPGVFSWMSRAGSFRGMTTIQSSSTRCPVTRWTAATTTARRSGASRDRR
jgi:hypothetical protein